MTIKDKIEKEAKEWAKLHNPECEAAAQEAYIAGMNSMFCYCFPYISTTKLFFAILKEKIFNLIKK